MRVPTSALVFREHGMEVATVGPDDTIQLKPIKLGRNLGTEVEVLNGLTLSDRVVNSPPDSLSTGDRVRIAGATDNRSAAEKQTSNSGNEQDKPEAKAR